MNAINNKREASTWMLVLCGVWLVVLGTYFIGWRPPLLPEDARFMNTTREDIRSALPGLERWLQHVFTVMGGFMAGAGVLTVFVATLPRARWRREGPWAIGLSGALTVGLMSATNFAIGSDFRWLLLVPAVLWLAAFAAAFAQH